MNRRRFSKILVVMIVVPIALKAWQRIDGFIEPAEDSSQAAAQTAIELEPAEQPAADSDH